MTKVFGLALTAALVFGVSTPIFANGKNWSADKSTTVDRNRNSNAGIGNAGERFYNGVWEDTWWGEDGPLDLDPGASGDHNQSCLGDTGVHPRDTTC